jgi:hypothetical protein
MAELQDRVVAAHLLYQYINQQFIYFLHVVKTLQRAAPPALFGSPHVYIMWRWGGEVIIQYPPTQYIPGTSTQRGKIMVVTYKKHNFLHKHINVVVVQSACAYEKSVNMNSKIIRNQRFIFGNFIMYNYYYNISSVCCGVITDYVGNINSSMQMFVMYEMELKTLFKRESVADSFS